MTVMMNGKIVLIGIMSLGKHSCEVSGIPGVGSRVSTHRQWILENSDAQQYQCFNN